MTGSKTSRPSTDMDGEVIRILARDGVELAVGARPAANADGPAVVVVHGIASHMGWYDGVARALQARGISAYLPDRRGCGISGGERGHAEDWSILVDDVRRVCEEVRGRHPGAPLGIIGLSLGGVFAAALAIRHPDLCDTLILPAPAFASSVNVPLARRLRVLRRSFTNPTKLYDLPFGPKEIVNRDDWRTALEGDALRTRRVSARFLTSMFRCQRFTSRQFWRIKVPTYCMLAEDDQVIDNAGVRRVVESGSGEPRWIETFLGAPHVIPSTLPRNALLHRLESWLRGAPQEAGPAVRTFETEIIVEPGTAFADPPDLSGAAT